MVREAVNLSERVGRETAGSEGKAGKEGKAGMDGGASIDGRAGSDGKIGSEVKAGKVGKAGIDGRAGKVGKAGKLGRAGMDDRAGKDGRAGRVGKAGKVGRADGVAKSGSVSKGKSGNTRPLVCSVFDGGDGSVKSVEGRGGRIRIIGTVGRGRSPVGSSRLVGSVSGSVGEGTSSVSRPLSKTSVTMGGTALKISVAMGASTFVGRPPLSRISLMG